MISETSKAYAAGFIDSEGSIFIMRRSPDADHHSPVHTLRVQAVNSYEDTLIWFYDRWGGSIHKAKKNDKGPFSTKPLWCWTVGSARALAFLEDIKPYLQEKHQKAELGILFQQSMCYRGHVRLLDEEVIKREGFRERMLALSRCTTVRAK